MTNEEVVEYVGRMIEFLEDPDGKRMALIADFLGEPFLKNIDPSLAAIDLIIRRTLEAAQHHEG